MAEPPPSLSPQWWAAELAGVHTPPAFTDALRALRGDRTVEAIAKRGAISKGTVQNLSSYRDAVPRWASVQGFLTGCGVTDARLRASWLDAYTRVYPPPPPPAGPRRLGGWTLTGAQGSPARDHFAAAATGRREAGVDGDWFRGRTAAVAAVQDWLTALTPPGRPMVITGQPGAGKSAVLARTVHHLQGGMVRGVAVYARGASLADVVAAIAKAAQITGKPSPAELKTTLEQRPEVPVLAVALDALDEAGSAQDLSGTDRHEIADLLSAIAKLPGVRVAVATRALAGDDPYATGSLLRRLGVTGPGDRTLVDLDSDAYFDPDGLRAFAVAVLTQDQVRHPGDPDLAWRTYRTDAALTGRLAAAIADQAGRNHLVAGLTAADLSTRATVLDPGAPGFTASSIPATVQEAIDKYLNALQPPHHQDMTRGLLTALAYACGDGVDDRRWLAFTAALGYPAVTQADLDRLTRSPAVDYLLHNSDVDGEPVTRLFHQALVDDQLRRRGNRQRSDQQALLATLLPATPAGWRDSDAYACRHAAEHAAAAGTLSTLVHDEYFLCVADLDRLSAVLPARPSPPDAPPVALLRRCGSRARDLPPDRRARLLALTAAHLGLPGWPTRFAATTPGQAEPIWAHSLGTAHQLIDTGPVRFVRIGRLGDRDVIATGGEQVVRLWDADGRPIGDPLIWYSSEIRAVTIGRLGDRDVIATGGDDATVRLWDTTGRPIGDPLTGHTSPVGPVVIGRLGDRDVIASAGYDGTVRLWDATGQPIGDLLTGHAQRVKAVAIGRLGDRDIIATTGYDDTVRLWDTTGQPIGDPLTGHTSPVNSVAIGRLGNRDIIASAGHDNTVRLWDTTGRPIGDPLTGHTSPVGPVVIGRLGDRDVIASAGYDGTRLWDATGRPIGEPLIGHTRPVEAVAIGRLGDRDIIASAADDEDGTVRLWDTTGQPIGDLTGHTRSVLAVAIGRLGDRDIIATAGGHDGTVRLWDTTGQPIGDLTGHTGTVLTVSIGRLGDRDVIASAGYNGTVRLWDATGQPIGDPLTGHTGTVLTVSIGRLGDRDVIASAGYDDTVRLWDTTGQPIGDPLTGHTSWVTAVAIGRLGDRDVLATGGADRTVRLWDTDGRPIGDPLTGHTGIVWAVAIGRLGDRDVLATADDDRTVWLWDEGGHSTEVWDFLEPVRALAFGPHGGVCVGSGRSLSWWTPRPVPGR